MDFKQNTFMILLGLGIIALILGQSFHFLFKAYRRGKALGIEKSTMSRTVVSSALFSITPALAIVATILALSPALGIVLPWIRLSVIGNILQETSAATAALESAGSGGLSANVTDPTVFSIVAWVMALGSMMPLVVLPLVLKRLQRGMKKVTTKDPKWTQIMSAAAFIGLISTFIARALIGKDTGKIVDGVVKSNNDGAGVMSVATLISSIVFMLVLQKIADKHNIRWLQSFAMPISMFAALGIAIILWQVLPAEIATLEWRPLTA